MANTTVWVSTDVALQGADLVSGGAVLNVKKGVEMLLLNNLFVEGGPATAGRGQCDVSALLKQGLDFLSKSPHETLGVAVGCRTPEIRKAYKRHALKYHPDKNPLTTPLFQLMSSAHDRLTDPTQRQKEERTAAAKQPRPKPPPPAPAPAPAPAAHQPQQPSANAGNPYFKPHVNANANANHQNNNPAQPKQSYDPKSNKWNGDAEWGKYAQQAPNPTEPPKDAKAQEAARRKQYYDEILREQFKKAESDRKAKEYAAMRDATNRARAAGATPTPAPAPAPAGNGFSSKPSSAGGASMGSAPGSSSSSKHPDPTPSNLNPNSYYSNPYTKKPYQKPEESSTGNSTNPNHYSRVPSAADPGVGTGAYSGRTYQATADGRVNPQNGPTYGKIPSRESPVDAPGGIYSSQPNSARRTSAAGAEAAAASRTKPSPAAPAAAPPPAASGMPPSGRQAGHGLGGGVGGDTNSSSSHNLRSSKANANRVPRPYGLRCLFVGANAAELEWVTSKYHRNSLLVELSWRIKEADMTASFRQTWESASKLISSGKCRKKNLVAGANYEFRVRAVEELSGGLLGYRSDWSDSILISLLPDKTTNSTHNASMHNLPLSPSRKGLQAKASYFGKHPTDEETASSGGDKSTLNSARDAHVSQPNLHTKPTVQPSQPAQPKSTNTFERFTPKPVEPKINIYDNLNTNNINNTYSTAERPDHRDRKSTSSIPTNNAEGVPLASKSSDPHLPTASTATKTKATATPSSEPPLKEMTKINLDNIKRTPVTLTGSGRYVWGDPEDTTTSTTSTSSRKDGKKTSTSTSAGAAARNKAEESTAEIEIDDEVHTVVDEDSSSVNTTSKSTTKSKPVKSAPVEMQKAAANNASTHRVNANPPAGAATNASSANTSSGMKKSTSGAPPVSHASPSISVPSSATPQKRSNKGEFADFTIEVDDDGEGSDDEIDSEDEEEDDDFEMEYEQVYTLYAPAARVKAKKTASSANLALYSHPVRAEPVLKSAIIGYLNMGSDVVACADAGNWLKVRIHKQPTRKNSKQLDTKEHEWGWSVRTDKHHEYLKPSLARESSHYTSHGELPPLHPPRGGSSASRSRNVESPAPTARQQAAQAGFKSPDATSTSTSHGFTPSTPTLGKSASNLHNPLGNRSMRAMPKNPHHSTPAAAAASSAAPPSQRASLRERDIPVWIELFDENGHTYYYNELSNESKWEPPEWVEEKDPASGAKYYVNLGSAAADPSAPLHSTWTKPEQFSRLQRAT